MAEDQGQMTIILGYEMMKIHWLRHK